MQTATVTQVVASLQKLPVEKLVVVYDFVSFLATKENENKLAVPASEAYQTMLTSEVVLRRDWDRPEEDKAWADL